MSGRLGAKGGRLGAIKGTLFLMNRRPVAAFVTVPQDLTIDFDASTSGDPDGAINNYAWNFGDGNTGTGVFTEHTYAAVGNYTVTLTVTDNGSLTDTISRVISVTLPDTTPPPPTNNFRVTDQGLTTVGTTTTAWLKLEWDLPVDANPGGGQLVSGHRNGRMERATGSTGLYSYMAQPPTATVSHTVTGLTQGQLYKFRKRESDNAGNSSAYTELSIVAGAIKPTAEFTFTTIERQISTDSRMSSDPDGTIVSRTWDWGDGSPILSYNSPTGEQITRVYEADGTFTVTLTVTDNQGQTAAISKQVTVSGPNLVMSDDFARVAAVPGVAPTGQAWVLATSTVPFETDGTHLFSTGYAAASRLHATVNSSEMRVQCMPKTQQSFDIISKYNNSNTYFYTTFAADGKISLFRRFNAQNRAFVLRSDSVTGSVSAVGKWLPGDTVTVEHRVVGVLGDDTVNTIPVRAIVRVNGTIILDAIDINGVNMPTGTAAGYRHNTAAVEQKITNWRVWTFSAAVVNQPPTASFTVAADGLLGTANAADSADPEGTPLVYSWNWGDGSTDTGQTTNTKTHTYAVGGDYTVTLTVVDGANKSASTTRLLTVGTVAPPPPPPEPDPGGVAVMAAPVISNRFVTIDSSASDRTATGYTLHWGDGTSSSSTSAPPTTNTHIYQVPGTYTARLIVVKGGVNHETSRPVPISTSPAPVFTRPILWPVNKPTLAGKLPYAPPDTTVGDWIEFNPTSTSRKPVPSDRNLIMQGRLINWTGSPQIDIPRTVNATTGKIPHTVIIGNTFECPLPPTAGAYMQAIKMSSWNPKGNTALERPGVVYLEGNKFLPHSSLRTGPGKLDWLDGHHDGKYWERLTYSTVSSGDLRWIEQNNFVYGNIHTRPVTGGHTGGDAGSQITSPIYHDIALWQNELWDLSYQGFYLEPWDSSTWRRRDPDGVAISVGDVFTDRLILAGARDRSVALPWYEEDQYSNEPNHDKQTGTTSGIRRFAFGDEVFAVSRVGASDRLWHPDYTKFNTAFKVRKHGAADMPTGWLNPDNLGVGYVSPGYVEPFLVS